MKKSFLGQVVDWLPSSTFLVLPTLGIAGVRSIFSILFLSLLEMYYVLM
jgi:hypothetical protein